MPTSARYSVVCPDGRVRHIDPFADLAGATAWAVFGCGCRLGLDLRQHGIVRTLHRHRPPPGPNHFVVVTEPEREAEPARDDSAA